MSNPDLHRYEKELVRHVSGFHRRKALLTSFRQSLIPFLEENPSPTYEDLLSAFGPPEQMVQNITQSTSLPDAPTKKGRIALILIGCFVVLVICLSVFFHNNTPETGSVLTLPVTYPAETGFPGRFVLEDPFTHNDSHWMQYRDQNAYLVEVLNTNSVSTKVFIRYSEIRPFHSFEVPPGETVTFSVPDACPGEHIISFSTPDGSLSGTVRVFASREAIV